MSLRPVLILTGPPGAGKTTAAGFLVARSPAAVHLEADTFFDFIRSGQIEPWKPESHEQNRAVMEIIGEAAASYSRAGYFTVIDGIVYPQWFLASLRETLQKAGCEVSYVALRAPLRICAGRVQIRSGKRFSEPAVTSLHAQFGDLGEFERHVLDVEGMSPAGVADVLERLLEEKTHLL